MKKENNLPATDSLKLIEKATNVAAEGIIITDASQAHNPIIFVNDGFERLTGFSREEILGRNCNFLQGKDTDVSTLAAIRQAIQAEREIVVELLNYRKDGTPFWNRLSITPIKDANGKLSHFVGVQSDISELKNTKAALEAANKELAHFYQEMNLELDQARTAQKVILPSRIPAIPTVTIAARYEPLTQIGGDFYDLVELDPHTFGIFIADVAGHGVPAALITFMTSITFKNASAGKLSTRAVLSQVNTVLQGKMPQGTFVTAIYLIYDADTRQIVFSQAGHPPGFLLRPQTGEVRKLSTEGTPLGILPSSLANQGEVKLQLLTDDKILLYTDALIEIADPKTDVIDFMDLQPVLATYINLPIEELLDKVFQYGLQMSGKSRYADDVTMVGFEITE